MRFINVDRYLIPFGGIAHLLLSIYGRHHESPMGPPLEAGTEGLTLGGKPELPYRPH